MATNHFTANFSNLNLHSHPYHGTNQVSIIYGSSIAIQNFGNGILPTSFGNFLHHYLFHVPSISRNLLSVRQFCLDNSVFFKFNFFGFLVNDLCTQEIHLRGPIKDGLYVLLSYAPAMIPFIKQALIGEWTSQQIWHSRLGHPSLHITSFTI